MLDYGEDPTVPPNRLAAHRQGGRQMAAPPPPAPPPNPTGTGKSYYGGQDVDEQMAAADPAQIQAMLKSKLGMGGPPPAAPPPPPNPAGSYAGSELDSALNGANGTDIEAMMRAGLGMAPPKQSWERPTMEWAGPQMAAQAKPSLNSWEMPTMDWAGPQMQAHAAALAASKQPTGPAPWSAGYTATSPSHSTWTPPVPDGGIMSGGKGGSYGEVENGGAYGSPLMQQLSGYSATSPSHSAWTPPDEGVMAGRGGSYGDVQNGGAYDPGMSPVMAKLRAAMANGTVPPAPQTPPGSIDYHPLAAGMTPGYPQLTGDDRGMDEPPAAAAKAPAASPPQPGMIDVPGAGQRAEPERPTAPPLPPPPPLNKTMTIDNGPNRTTAEYAGNGPNSLANIKPPPLQGGAQWGPGGATGGTSNTPIFAPTWQQYLANQPGGILGHGVYTYPELEAMQARNAAMGSGYDNIIKGQQANSQTGLGLGSLAGESGKTGVERQKVQLDAYKAQMAFDPRTTFTHTILPQLLKEGKTSEQIKEIQDDYLRNAPPQTGVPFGAAVPPPPPPLNSANPTALMPGGGNGAATPTNANKADKPPSAAEAPNMWRALKDNMDQGKEKAFPNDLPGFLKTIKAKTSEGYLAKNLPEIMKFAKAQYGDAALRKFMGRGNPLMYDTSAPMSEQLHGMPLIGGLLGGHTDDDILRAQLRAAGH